MAQKWSCPMCGQDNKNKRTICYNCQTSRFELVLDRTPPDPDGLEIARAVAAAFITRKSKRPSPVAISVSGGV